MEFIHSVNPNRMVGLVEGQNEFEILFKRLSSPTITIYRKISVSLASRLVVSQMTSPQRLPRDKATGQCPSRTFLSHLNFALASDRLNSAYLATACSRLEGLASFLEKSLRSFLGDNGRFFPSHDERKVCEPKLLRSACKTQHL